MGWMSNDALIAKYEGLLKARPNDELILFSLGKALIDAGRLVEAEAYLRLALEKKPDWMIVTMLLAKIADQKEDLTTAKALWEKGLELAIAQHHDDPADECRAELARLALREHAQRIQGT
jgi:Flp pilus assembly protein TadD